MTYNKIGSVQQKVLLLLLSGIALGFTNSPRKQFNIIRGIPKAWEQINKQTLQRSIAALYRSRLIREQLNDDGTTTLVLNNKGQHQALRFKLHEIKIPRPPRWDGKWRIALFDIPETQKKLREAFRWHLKQLGFHELQKSVFTHPYECKKELDFIIEYYQARKYVRFLVAEEVDNSLHLEKQFNI